MLASKFLQVHSASRKQAEEGNGEEPSSPAMAVRLASRGKQWNACWENHTLDALVLTLAAQRQDSLTCGSVQQKCCKSSIDACLVIRAVRSRRPDSS